MTKSESKYFATAVKMDEAFLALLEKKDFAYITVKEICAAAGVNRSTFYLHYETINDLLEESAGYINQQFVAYMQHDTRNFAAKIKTCPLNKLYLVTPEYLTPYLSYIKEHQRLFRTAIKATVLGIDNTYQRMFRYIFTPILDRFGVPAPDRAYTMTFFIQGFMGIIREWLKNDCDAPVEYIVKMIEKCISNRWEKE